MQCPLEQVAIPATNVYLSDNGITAAAGMLGAGVGAPLNATNYSHVLTSGSSASQWSQLRDGTIEVTDRLPKKEYYMSLRRFNPSISPQPTGNDTLGTHRLGSISSGSMLGAGNGSTDQLAGGGGTNIAPTSPLLTDTLRRERTNTSVLNFKPSGKTVDCTVVMLDGTTREFRLDKAAYGQQLFDSVTAHLGLLEVDFFGITYYDSTHNWFWLQLDQKITKQVGRSDWQFEFQVKFYPCDMDSIKEDLTRYYLCLQVRQDLVSGQLPCSFMTYCLLGAYIVQSEAGDHDPTQHIGIKYIQDHPFAPNMLQTPEMLERIVQLHELHRGKTPEEADRLFLNNARCLALYGVDLHKVKTSQNEDINLGVYHSGILLYRNRIRLMRIPWLRIVSFSQKGRNFLLVLRPVDSEPMRRDISFKCINASFAKRLYSACVEHHAFFRLRSSSRPKKPSLFPSFATRKYHYPIGTLYSPNDNGAENGRSRPISTFRAIPTHSNNAGWFTLAGQGTGYGAMASQYQYQPSLMASAAGGVGGTYGTNGHALYVPDDTREQRQPMVNGDKLQSGQRYPTSASGRPVFQPEHWRISPGDRTTGLGMDARGLDVAAQRGAGWQGCRANKGVKAPGAYYFEAACIEDGLVRVGWSTNEANLELGADTCGFGYGSDAMGAAGAAGAGRMMHRNAGHDYGVVVHQGDVIGCLLDLDKGSVAWSCNGKVFQRAFTILDQLRGECFLPAASLKDSRLLFNFGDQPLMFHPGTPYVPVVQASDDNQVPNRNTGWRLNPYDATPCLDVAPDGSMVQAAFGQNWQGCRANQGIRGPGRFYFEVSPLEEVGLCRIGWSTEEGSLNLGSDRFGFGYGADNEGFGLTGHQGKRMHNDEIENYGEAFSKGDVIGCFLDTIEHTVKWSKNGIDFGDAYRIPSEFANPTYLSAFFPTFSLLNSTVAVNFGDKPFQFYPGPDWTPLHCVSMDYIKRTRRKGPERKVKGWSYIDPSLLEPAAIQHQLRLSQEAAAIGAARSVERREENLSHSTKQAAPAGGTSPTPRSLPPGAVPMPGMVTITAPGGTPGSGIFSPRGPSVVNGKHYVVSSTPTNSQSPPAASPQGKDGVGCASQSPVLVPTSAYNLVDCVHRVVNGEIVSIRHSEPQVETDSYIDEHGKRIKRTVRRSEVTTTKTVSERIIQNLDSQLDATGARVNGHQPTDDFDQALDIALHEVTNLNRDVSVVGAPVGQVEIRSKLH